MGIMKLNITPQEEKKVYSYRISHKCANSIESLAKENKCSRGEVIEYALEFLYNKHGK
jgi:hypothetical protein